MNERIAVPSFVTAADMPATYALLSDQDAMNMKAYGMGYFAKRGLLAFLKDFFRDPENSGGTFHFVSEAETTTHPGDTLRIISNLSQDQKTVENRPMIVVTRTSTTPDTPTFKSGMRGRDMLSGDEVREHVTHIGFNLGVYSRVPDEAERLAEIVMHVVNCYNDELRNLFGWHKVRATGMGPQTPVQVDSQITLACVTVSVQGQYVTAYRKSKKAKKLAFVPIISGVAMDGDGTPRP